MAVEIHWLRPTGGAVPYEDWKDDAACDGSDTRMFEIDAPARQMSGEEQDRAHELVARGLQICNTCPVKSSCLLNSTEEDRYWTTRGGQPPEGLFEDADHPIQVRLRAHPRKGGRQRQEKCGRGHNNWRERAKGGRRCLDCAKEDDRKRVRTKSAKVG